MTDSAPTSEPKPAPDRRSFLRGVAIAGVALPFAVACGSSDGSSANVGSTPPSSKDTTPAASDPTSSSGGGADVLTASSDVPVGGGVILPDADTVVTQPTKGTFAGFAAHCTHAGCLFASVSDGTINCTCHGSKFSIKDGSVVNGPATEPLPKKTVKAEGSDIVAG